MSQLQTDFPNLVDHELDLLDLRSPSEIPETFRDFIVAVRRHIHRHPELGFEEHRTHEFLREVLEQHGLDVQGPVAKTGLFVDIAGAESGPMVAYRADIDALPTHDAKETPYASTLTGTAHLCGHDAHSAVAAGTALILHANRHRLKGTVRVFFQPNEEGMPGGATTMVQEGIVDAADAIYAIHVDPTLEVGKYGLLAGPITAATDQFRVSLKAGSTGHSARPHETVDTIWIATQMANTLYQLIGRVTDARNPSVMTICRFHAGEAFNVIPAEVEFGGTIRTTNLEDRSTILNYVRKTAGEIATMHGAVATVDVDSGSPPVDNDLKLVAHIETAIREFFGEEAVFHVPRPSMGAEDFAHYLQYVPGVLLRVGTYSGPATAYPLHDAHFDIDESALAPTSVLLARVLASHLERRPL